MNLSGRRFGPKAAMPPRGSLSKLPLSYTLRLQADVYLKGPSEHSQLLQLRRQVQLSIVRPLYVVPSESLPTGGWYQRRAYERQWLQEALR